MVEIIVLLPHLFKNKAIAARFMNNYLTAAVHFRILEEHGQLHLSTEIGKDKARKTLADEYRRTMRKIQPSWTKATHTEPIGWDSNFLAMDGFVPDNVNTHGYSRPASIPFRELTIGVKKLPANTDAGDLTRAVQFGLQQSEDYMFPDDLPTILDHVGRTTLTLAHTDRLIVRRYADVKRRKDVAKEYRLGQTSPYPTVQDFLACCISQEVFQQSIARTTIDPSCEGDQPPPEMPAEAHSQPLRDQFIVDAMQLRQGWKFLTANDPLPDHTLTPNARVCQNLEYGVDKLFYLPFQFISHATDMVNTQGNEQPRSEDFYGSRKTMDDLLRPHLNQAKSHLLLAPTNPSYASQHLLRNCIEGNIGFDGSMLSHAAQFARRPDQVGTDWYVKDAPFIAELLSFVPLDS